MRGHSEWSTGVPIPSSERQVSRNGTGLLFQQQKATLLQHCKTPPWLFSVSYFSCQRDSHHHTRTPKIKISWLLQKMLCVCVCVSFVIFPANLGNNWVIKHPSLPGWWENPRRGFQRRCRMLCLKVLDTVLLPVCPWSQLPEVSAITHSSSCDGKQWYARSLFSDWHILQAVFSFSFG